MTHLTDEKLDAYIRTRLETVGIDLSVLPLDDPAAPCDQRRVLASARNMLRVTIPAISRYSIDVQDVPPVAYPAALAPLLSRAGDETGGGIDDTSERVPP